MPKISVEIPAELLADLDEHVGDDGKFVNRSDAVRASIRKTLDLLDGIDARHGRLTDERGVVGPSAVERSAIAGSADGTDASLTEREETNDADAERTNE